MESVIDLDTSYMRAVFNPKAKGTHVTIDPLKPERFEISCEGGLVIWGEAWGEGGEPLVVRGPAQASHSCVNGSLYIDVRVDGVLEMRIPVVQVMAVAPAEDANQSVEFLVDTRNRRILQ